jgi:hypothetical protein
MVHPMIRSTLAAILLILTLAPSVSAQNGVRFGLKGGYSLSTQYGIIEPDMEYTVDVFYRHGVTAGLLVYYPITEVFGVQQEFLYVQKGSIEDIDLIDRPIYSHTEYDLNYFEIPMLMRWSFANLGAFTLYGTSGFALSILLNGEYRLNGIAEIEGAAIQFEDSNKIDGVDIFDYAFLYGMGVEKELMGREFFFSYRFTIGWNTLMMPTAEGEDPAPLRNQNYAFTLGLYL